MLVYVCLLPFGFVLPYLNPRFFFCESEGNGEAAESHGGARAREGVLLWVC